MPAQTKSRLFLEDLQAHYYAYLGKYYTREAQQSTMLRYPEEFAQFFSGHPLFDAQRAQKQMSDDLNVEVPTRFENPIAYSMIMEKAEKIEGVMSSFSISLPDRPLFGTLATGRVNAMAISISSSKEYIVLLETGIFSFANLLSKVVARVLPKTLPKTISLPVDDTNISRTLDENPEIIQHFTELLLAYLLTGVPDNAPPYLLREQFELFSAGMLTRAVEFFVIGHEYGHLIKGHLTNGKTVKTMLGDEKVDELIYSWQQELEADAQGAELMLNAMQKEGWSLAIAFAGADLFFSGVDVIERGASVIRTGQESRSTIPSSHPPPKVRRLALRYKLARSLPGEIAIEPVFIAEYVEKTMEALWGKLHPTLLKLHKEGQKLAPIWS